MPDIILSTIFMSEYMQVQVRLKATLLIPKVIMCLSVCHEALSQEYQLEDKLEPGVRNGHSMVYHSSLQGLFMFGGANEREVKGDTWLWTKQQWQKLSDDGPQPRTFPSMVYRSKTADVILFGGNKVLFGGDDRQGLLLNDTWIWKDGTWVMIETKDRPQPRSEASMAYDHENDKIILFGGFKFSDDGKSLIRLGDTWEFDGQNWKQIITSGPSPRSGSAMTYEFNLSKVILFGGNFARSEADKSAYNGNTWVFDGVKWDSVASSSPNLYNTALTYDHKNKRIIRFGGWNGKQRVNETWEFKKLRWNSLNLRRLPEPRNHSVIVYDETKNRIILFGGHNGDEVFGDMWELRKSVWKKIYDHPKRKRIENNH